MKKLITLSMLLFVGLSQSFAAFSPQAWIKWDESSSSYFGYPNAPVASYTVCPGDSFYVRLKVKEDTLTAANRVDFVAEKELKLFMLNAGGDTVDVMPTSAWIAFNSGDNNSDYSSINDIHADGSSFDFNIPAGVAATQLDSFIVSLVKVTLPSDLSAGTYKLCLANLDGGWTDNATTHYELITFTIPPPPNLSFGYNESTGVLFGNASPAANSTVSLNVIVNDTLQVNGNSYQLVVGGSNKNINKPYAFKLDRVVKVTPANSNCSSSAETTIGAPYFNPLEISTSDGLSGLCGPKDISLSLSQFNLPASPIDLTFYWSTANAVTDTANLSQELTPTINGSGTSAIYSFMSPFDPDAPSNSVYIYLKAMYNYQVGGDTLHVVSNPLEVSYRQEPNNPTLKLVDDFEKGIITDSTAIVENLPLTLGSRCSDAYLYLRTQHDDVTDSVVVYPGTYSEDVHFGDILWGSEIINTASTTERIHIDSTFFKPVTIALDNGAPGIANPCWDSRYTIKISNEHTHTDPKYTWVFKTDSGSTEVSLTKGGENAYEFTPTADGTLLLKTEFSINASTTITLQSNSIEVSGYLRKPGVVILKDNYYRFKNEGNFNLLNLVKTGLDEGDTDTIVKLPLLQEQHSCFKKSEKGDFFLKFIYDGIGADDLPTTFTTDTLAAKDDVPYPVTLYYGSYNNAKVCYDSLTSNVYLTNTLIQLPKVICNNDTSTHAVKINRKFVENIDIKSKIPGYIYLIKYYGYTVSVNDKELERRIASGNNTEVVYEEFYVTSHIYNTLPDDVVTVRAYYKLVILNEDYVRVYDEEIEYANNSYRIVAANKGVELQGLEDRYCLYSGDLELKLSSSITVLDSISIYNAYDSTKFKELSSKNDRWYFNPKNVADSLGVQCGINYYYHDNNECLLSRTDTFFIDPDYQKTTLDISNSLGLDSVYCVRGNISVTPYLLDIDSLSCDYAPAFVRTPTGAENYQLQFADYAESVAKDITFGIEYTKESCMYKDYFTIKVDPLYGIDASAKLHAGSQLFPDTFCIANKEYALKLDYKGNSDYTINKIEGSPKLISEKIAEQTKKYSLTTDSAQYSVYDLHLEYSDINGCKVDQTYYITINDNCISVEDNLHLGDYSASNNDTIHLCILKEGLPFSFNERTHRLITAQGNGIYSDKDNNYYYSSWLAYQKMGFSKDDLHQKDSFTDVVNLAFITNDSCRYTRSVVIEMTTVPYDTAHRVSLYYVDNGLRASLPTQFCYSNNSYKVISDLVTIDSLSGKGFRSNPDEYRPADLFPENALTTDMVEKTDLVKVFYTDTKGCMSVKRERITVNAELASIKMPDIYWEEANDKHSFVGFCMGSDQKYKINALNSIGIDTIIGKAVNKDASNDYFYYPDRAAEKSDTFTVHYTINATECKYHREVAVKLGNEFVLDLCDLVGWDSTYCAKDVAIVLQKSIPSHTIDSVYGAGVVANDNGYGVVYSYNPFEVFNTQTLNVYSSSVYMDSITAMFTDTRNCAYTKKYPVQLSGAYADTVAEIQELKDGYCKNSNAVKLIVNYETDSIVGLGITQNVDNQKWYLEPSHNDFSNVKNDQNSNFTWYYRDNDNCVWSKQYTVKLYERPLAQFVPTELCFGDYALFKDSTILHGTSTIRSRSWDLGDGYKLEAGSGELFSGGHNETTKGSYEAVRHKYKDHGVKSVSLHVMSDNGCADDTTQQVVIGNYPRVNFSYENVVVGSPTLFSNFTTAEEYDSVSAFHWDFDYLAATPNKQTVSTSEQVEQTYLTPGVHQVNLKAVTHNQCASDTTIKVPVFPFYVLNDTYSYTERFNTGASGWLVSEQFDRGSGSGWALTALESPFSWYGNDSGAMWLTAQGDDFIPNENSWIESPQFYIDDLSSPVLSVDLFHSIEAGSDGAVIQYSLNNGNDWEVLGDINQGRNWYNHLMVFSNPGNQEGVSVGWSKNSGAWQTAYFSLDNLRAKSQQSGNGIRFRIAFASDLTNKSKDPIYGFGVDNFTISSRKRIVLIEQFQNTTYNKEEQLREASWLNSFVESRNQEVVDIRYHNFISHDVDPLYYLNQSDNSARSMEYGAQLNQLTVVDGIFRALSPAEELTTSYYRERALTDNKFSIDASVKKSGDSTMDSLIIESTITKLVDSLILVNGSQRCFVRMAIVQKEMLYKDDLYRNVLLELLPNGVGNQVGDLAAIMEKGEQKKVIASWKPDVSTVGNQFRLIIFVQSISGVNEVHQVWYKDLNPSEVPQYTVTKNLEIEPEADLVQDEISIYPNPVEGHLYVKFISQGTVPVSWNITNMAGLLLKQGEIPKETTLYEINLSDLVSGVYQVNLYDAIGHRLEPRKIVVKNN